MQLKIEKKRTYNVYVVSGDVLPKDVRVIYDGLKSAFAVSKNPIILSLTTATVAPNVMRVMHELQLIPLKVNCDLLIVGPTKPAQFTNLADAERLLQTGGTQIAIVRIQMMSDLQAYLENKVSALSKQQSELTAQYVDAQNLPQEIQAMKVQLMQMAEYGDELLKQLASIDKETKDVEAAASLNEIEGKMLKIIREGTFQISETMFKAR